MSGRCRRRQRSRKWVLRRPAAAATANATRPRGRSRARPRHPLPLSSRAAPCSCAASSSRGPHRLAGTAPHRRTLGREAPRRQQPPGNPDCKRRNGGTARREQQARFSAFLPGHLPGRGRAEGASVGPPAQKAADLIAPKGSQSDSHGKAAPQRRAPSAPLS